MNKCKRCNVWVADDTMVCPLCHTILTEEKSKGQKSGSGFPDSEFEYNGARYVDIDSVADKRFLIQGPGYPDVKKNTRRFRKAGRILLFMSLALEMLLVFINYLTFDMAPKYWSVVTGGIIAYLILTMWDIFSRRQGHIRKIYTQIFVILGLMILIDFALDWSGWSLEFGLPCIIYGLVLAIIICMSVNSSSWQNYLLMQLAAIALSILDVVLHFTGYLHHIVLAWIAFGLSVLLWSGTMIIGDRKAKNELKRKLHI